MPKLSSHEIDILSDEDFDPSSYDVENLTKKQVKSLNKQRLDDYFYNKELNDYYKTSDDYWDDLENEIINTEIDFEH